MGEFKEYKIGNYARGFHQAPITKAEYKLDTEFKDDDAYKQYELERIKVTVSTGKVFYADPISRTDLADAISLATETGVSSTYWKLAEPIEGNKIALVTVDELKEARMLGLQSKGQIVGAV